MDYDKLLELHDTLYHTLDFLKYHSESPQELDDRVREQIELIETELQTHNPEFESVLLYI